MNATSIPPPSKGGMGRRLNMPRPRLIILAINSMLLKPEERTISTVN
jgi:hypothetical protein